MPYKPLPKITVAAVPDETGQNNGNLSSMFTTSVLNVHVAWYEVYHAVVTSVPAGGQAQVNIGTVPYSFTYPLGGSEWDPAQPMLLQDGQEVYFLWNIAATVKPVPVVTLWMRYDPTLTGNPS